MLDGPAVVGALETCGVSHLVWIPDSSLGTWEPALRQATLLKLIRATREGEAVALAGGLLLGGARPVVAIQCTGLFEAGDALRNVVYDLGLPLHLIVGVRSWYAHQAGKTADNCPHFAEPLVRAWELPYVWIDPRAQSAGDLVAALRGFQRDGKAGVILWAE
ncbi:MAG TPA: hypothetical protein VIL46_10830 [Gemmataceae bacterium]